MTIMEPSLSKLTRKRALSDSDVSDIQKSDEKRAKNMNDTMMQVHQHSHLPNTIPSTIHWPIVNLHPGSSAFPDARYVRIHNSSFYETVYMQTIEVPNNVEKYRKWLMPCDPSTNHRNAVAKHHLGTGLWFLECNMYKYWKQEKNSLMWIHGISGAGKTVLFSNAVQDIHSFAKKGSIGLAYFYCDISDARKSNVADILSSLIVNLFAWQPPNQLFLEKTYQDCMEGLSKPFNERLLEILKEFISGFEMVYILIDALDECLDWEEVLKFINILHGWESSQCHLLVTSRKEQQIVKSMMSMSPMEIDMSRMPVDDDIGKYIDSMLGSSLQLKEWGSEEKGLIRKVLLEKANGMFRWVACQLDELKKCTKRRKTLNYILESLPETLEGTYDQILSRIPLADAPCAVKLLLWLAFAKQPLHIDYLAIVVEFDMNKNTFDPDAKLSSPADVLKICSSLVTKMDDNTVQLAHASVKKYIQDKKRELQGDVVANPSIGDEYIGQCCLVYLLHSRDSHPTSPFQLLSKTRQDRYQHSLVRYAAKYWSKHLLKTNLNRVFQKIKELFVHDSFASENWVKVYNYDLGVHGEFGLERMWVKQPLQWAALHGLTEVIQWLLPTIKIIAKICGALNTASLYQHMDIVKVLIKEVEEAVNSFIIDGNDEKGCYSALEENGKVNLKSAVYGDALLAASAGGHVGIVQLLLESGADINANKWGEESALQVAAGRGHYEIVQILLERGANVNAQDTLGGNALQASSGRGHQNIVQLLLEGGADVNAQGGQLGNALQAASRRGYHRVVQLLLARGADVNAQGGYYGSALQAASGRGDHEVVQLLLERGADVNAEGRHFGNSLQAASVEGHHDLVQLLLERGANVNAQGGEFGNALQAASVEGHHDVAQLLLERGADVNAQGGYYGNALQAASVEGYYEIVQLLLDRGADVNAQGGYYGNALQAASGRGHYETVQLLVKKGADVNAQGGYYGSALQAASEPGHHEIIQLLLERGADVKVQGGQFGDALQAASGNGHYEIVELLLQRGADINSQGGYFGGALQAASGMGHYDIVEVLLERGIDVNTQGGYYGNALQASSGRGYHKIVQLLLERGADVNAQGGQLGNALQAASRKGHYGVVQLLLERGADVNAQGGYYGDALQAASGMGNHEIVQLLIERGADVDVQGGYYGNALQAASRYGHHEIVQLLLERGVDVNSQGGELGNALQAASVGGHNNFVELLLEQGADVNATGGKYGNSLLAASFHGNIIIVILLLKAGAKLNCQCAVHVNWQPVYSNPAQTIELCDAIQAASFQGHGPIVKILLDCGDGQTQLDAALQLAQQRGHQHVVDILLKHGAKQE